MSTTVACCLAAHRAAYRPAAPAPTTATSACGDAAAGSAAIAGTLSVEARWARPGCWRGPPACSPAASVGAHAYLRGTVPVPVPGVLPPGTTAPAPGPPDRGVAVVDVPVPTPGTVVPGPAAVPV